MVQKMIASAGRDKDGIARPVKTDAQGAVETTISASKVEYVMSSKANPVFDNLGHGDLYEMRTTAQRLVRFPHAINLDGTPKGIFEQSIFIANGYNAALTVDILPSYTKALNQRSWMTDRIERIVIPAGGSLLVLADMNSLVTNTGTRLVKAYPEFRSAIPFFEFSITPATAPTTGELTIVNTRRY